MSVTVFVLYSFFSVNKGLYSLLTNIVLTEQSSSFMMDSSSSNNNNNTLCACFRTAKQRVGLFYNLKIGVHKNAFSCRVPTEPTEQLTALPGRPTKKLLS